MDFFRYGARRHTDSLLALGGVRIGTLHDFRRSEHKRGVADPMEGKKIVGHYIGHHEFGVPSQHDRAIEQLDVIQYAPGVVGSSISNVTIARQFDTSDFFVLCGAQELSRAVSQEFDGNDSCAQITDISGFAARMAQTLSLTVPIARWFFAPVKYGTKNEVWNGADMGGDPALIKEPIFQGQKEIRIIWVPRSQSPIEPKIVTDVGLVKYVKDVSFIKNN